jgi:glucan phosphoethanolaminetransferase (alkaline phosphatase superfamily)
MDYLKAKKIKKIENVEKYSNLVGCMNRCQAQKIELLLLVANIVAVILCIMNLLIIPWKILNNSLKVLRVFILTLFVISLICVIYNIIVRKRQKLTIGYYYCVSFFGSIISQILIIINFILVLISCILVVIKIKSYIKKSYEYKSILIIDIFTLLDIIAIVFLWYTIFLLIYAKTDESIKDYIETKQRYIPKNQKMVSVELGDDVHSNSKNIIHNFNNIKNSINNDVNSSNKMEMNDKLDNNNNKKYDLSNVNAK